MCIALLRAPVRVRWWCGAAAAASGACRPGAGAAETRAVLSALADPAAPRRRPSNRRLTPRVGWWCACMLRGREGSSKSACAAPSHRRSRLQNASTSTPQLCTPLCTSRRLLRSCDCPISAAARTHATSDGCSQHRVQDAQSTAFQTAIARLPCLKRRSKHQCVSHCEQGTLCCPSRSCSGCCRALNV